MAITLLDVARRAGVSKSAASRTFTSGASVSAVTRAKVEAAAKELGYAPNLLASSLTTGRTKLIGLISNNFSNPYFLEIFKLFTRDLQAAGLRPLLVNLGELEDPSQSQQMLRAYSVDGVIVASSTMAPGLAERLMEGGLPVVHAFGWSRSTPPTDLAGIDNRAAGQSAAATLRARGYEKIAFLGGPEEGSTTQERLAGFTAASRPPDPTIHFSEAYSFEAGRAAMAELLASDQPEAVFCGDDVIAIGALSAAQEAGLSVPGDIGLLGLNDMEMAGWANIALTTIRQPTAQIVADAVDLVQRRIAMPDAPVKTTLAPFELIERGTLRPVL